MFDFTLEHCSIPKCVVKDFDNMNQSEALKRGSKVNTSCNLAYNINKENDYKKKRDCDDQR